MPPFKPRAAGAGRSTAESPQGLAAPLQYLKGIGPQRAKLLAKLGLEKVEDALFFLPARHEDRSQLTLFRGLRVGDLVTTTGTVACISPPPRGRPSVPLRLTLRDSTGYLNAVWFNQPYLGRVFRRGQRLIVHGKVQAPYRHSGPLELHVKDYEVVEEADDETLHTGRLVPVYGDRKSTRLNSSHIQKSRMPSSA